MKKLLSVLLSLAMIISFCVFSNAGEKTMVVLGDSISQGSGIYNHEEACYGRIVADTIGYSCSNFGVNGLRSWDLIEMLEDDNVREKVAEADIICLSIGGNDFLQQNLPLIFFQVLFGNFKTLDDIERNYREYFGEIISTVRSLNPDATFLVSLLYNSSLPLIKDFYGLAVERVNRVINETHEAGKDEFILFDPSEAMNGHPECVAFDTIHPSAVGNVRIARLMLEKLCELGISQTAEPVINKKGIDEIPYSSYILEFLFSLFK